MKQGNVDILVAGNSREMGLAQGAQLRAQIHLARRAVDQVDALRILKPAWMPYAIFRKVCERRASQTLGRALERDYPEAKRRFEGISAGSGVSIDALYLFAAMESMLSDKRNATATPAIGACSAVAVRRGRSALGEPVVVRNFDYIPLVKPFYIMRKSDPRHGLKSLDFTMAPFAGTVDGVNEKGLCVTYNYAYTNDVPAERSAPISVVVAEALRCCATTSEAAAWIESRPRWGGGILMLADAEGEIASLELSSTRSQLRMARPSEDVLFHTNTFWTGRMREVQIPDHAVYTDQAPLFLRGTPLHESAVARRSRLETLLQPDGPLSLDALGRIMADHGNENKPDYKTLCVHGPYWGTTASLQLFPKSRRMRVAFDSACQAQHEEIAL